MISALVRPTGAVAGVLFDARGRVDLLSPPFILEELELHADRLADETGNTPENVRMAMERLVHGIRIVPDELIDRKAREQADILAGHIDPKDVAYVALALSQEAVLWTMDQKLARGLARQDVHIAVDIFTVRTLLDQQAV